MHVVAVEQVVVARRVVCGVAEFADLDANALLDEPDDLVARVGARAGLLYVLARHVRRVGEDASVLRPLVVEEDDEAGAVVREPRDCVGESGEEFFERAPLARRGGEGRQRFELADGRAQVLFGRGPLVGVDFGQGHGFPSEAAATRTRAALTL